MKKKVSQEYPDTGKGYPNRQDPNQPHLTQVNPTWGHGPDYKTSQDPFQPKLFIFSI